MATTKKFSAEEKKKWEEERKAMLPIFLVQLVLGFLLTSGILYGGYYLCDCIPVPLSSELGAKLTYYIRTCVFPAVLVLFHAVMSLANRRGSTPAANPLSGNEHFLILQKNYLANTVEQLLIFLMISLVLITYLDNYEMKIIPVYSFLWVVGRVLFRIGYGINPRYRSLGMVTHLLSTPFFFGVLFYLMYTRGVMYGVEVGGSAFGNGGGKIPPKTDL